ncbi:hypothetical protein PBI_BALSA_43 [Microbacterium phage Balsa]|uniref:Uncharacterized protein n=2 Tax=Ilzatvirus hamlet TaxID=2560591 RepID=A0A2L0HP01_9CAUD|nr:hypothetical protein PBI_PEPPINO_44 [Microbacterium phage Peppino]AUX83569.1 hypothetical protein PBI_BALSA_43 [Microbacterium phage Balsa]
MDLGKRFSSHVLKYDEENLLSNDCQNVLFQDMQAKLLAEQQRLERLLPDPPPGYHWVWGTSMETKLGVLTRDQVQITGTYTLEEF